MGAGLSCRNGGKWKHLLSFKLACSTSVFSWIRRRRDHLFLVSNLISPSGLSLLSSLCWREMFSVHPQKEIFVSFWSLWMLRLSLYFISSVHFLGLTLETNHSGTSPSHWNSVQKYYDYRFLSWKHWQCALSSKQNSVWGKRRILSKQEDSVFSCQSTCHNLFHYKYF